ncbi:hypothetical protein D9Q98_002813 [Chlorella vulgaris]|uniref:Uncharacterized protein n=1 Tax=Chlorella vulgaris TaxID=3077 RepID=A0A9D4YZH0_CHLVU|nr:hypothetical protein D9Q98_002813 [Chlorella vulgaris]
MVSSSTPSRAAVRREWSKGWSKIVRYQQALAKANSAYFVHRRGPHDKLLSVAIPLGLTAVGTALVLPGVYHMVLGVGKKE